MIRADSISDSLIISSRWIIPLVVALLGLVTLALIQNEVIVIVGFAALCAFFLSGLPQVRLLLLIALLPFAHAGIGLELLPGFGVYNIYIGFVILLFLIRYIFVEHFTSNKIPVLPFSFIMLFAFIPSLIHTPDLTLSGLGFLNLFVNILTATVVYSLLNQIQSQSFVTTLLKTFVIIACIISLYGIYESITSASVFALFTGRMFFRLFGDVNYYASYLLMAIALSMGFVFIANRWIHKLFYIVVSILLTVAVVATVSRSALATLILIVFAYIGYELFYHKGSRKIIGLLLIAVLVFSIGILVLTDVGARVIDVFTLTQRVESAVVGGDASFEERRNILRVGIKMAAAHPIIGSGFGAFEAKYAEFQGALLSTGLERSAHNTAIRIFAETGIIGFIPAFLFILFLLFYLMKGVRYSRNEEHSTVLFAILSAIISFLLMSLFLDMMFEPHFWVMIGIGVFYAQNILHK